MPTYDWQCAGCGKWHETIQTIKNMDVKPENNPSCCEDPWLQRKRKPGTKTNVQASAKWRRHGKKGHW